MTLHDPTAGRGDGDAAHAVLDRQQDRLARGELQARLVEPRWMEPAKAVGQDQRERDAKRKVGTEEIEPDEDRLTVRLFERVDERAADRLHERAPGGERANPQRVVDRDLRELDVTHDRMVAVPVHDGRSLAAATEHLDRYVGGDSVDEDESPRSHPRRTHRVEDDDVA